MWRSAIWKKASERRRSSRNAALANQRDDLCRIPSLSGRIGASASGTMAGISLHTELELLVRLGLSPREALAAATNNYALQFGWNELGLIAPGRRADILVVDGDPTQNVWNARRISTLIMDGNVLDRDACCT